jgi:hypothetical protein
MTDTPELKPCPFCGGDYQTWGNVRDGRALGCSKCGVGFVEYNGPPENTAESRLVRKWNTRPDLHSEALEAAEARGYARGTRGNAAHRIIWADDPRPLPGSGIQPPR